MRYEHEGVALTEQGASVDGGPAVPWADLDRILGALLRVAHDRMGWFSIEAPPSSCERARGEAKDIVKNLFWKGKEKP